jgi:tRNA dimethylallyltransferase
VKNTTHFLIVIAGPTAVGKTDTSISIAQTLKSEIISADSRQFYKELKIGAAPPSLEQLAQTPHHFIGIKNISDYYNVSRYEQDVLKLLPELFKKNPIVIMTGGSGLYIDSVCFGIDDMPEFDPELRNILTERMNTEGVESLRVELKKLDPITYGQIDLKNKNRIFRALEMCLLTGKPYSDFLLKTPKTRPFQIIKIALNIDRNELHNKINKRTDQMMDDGLLEEARNLLPYRHHNALKTVGYKELFDYFDGNMSLEVSVELIKRNTRRYARKQISWFNRNTDYTWFAPDQVLEITSFIQNEISKKQNE